ncbi:alpha-beta hydrolase superfamily lysophospholipase [Neolewinella xylanilytica]|uniref:Alpha-beta hydrolase superfamily lysophospholipase n=1 Tax=Neolewinella xylanilytica TaxID=1514080 RepID=A0A2S6I5N1_9BACT|nr:alpha/beta hydrolase [Neolewinella xylanilytica]PPK86477.1 alpha-beta hydrolase superfamily lysophospholipase [Neolewinella xylanilytica]
MDEFHWKNEEGLRIYAVDWHVDNPRAIVGIIHGLGEHCRRYEGVAEFFNAHGMAVIGYDRQGFGRSEGRKGYAKNYRSYLDGVAQLMVHCERRYPHVPVFLYGHSMGGQLLLHYLIHRKPAIRGAIVSAPHIAEAFKPNPLVVAVGKLMRRVYPTFTLDNQLDLSALSRDPAVIEAYRKDAYVHTRLSSQTGIDLLDRALFLQRYAGGLPVPTLLLHGKGDRITSPDATAGFAERNPGGVTLKVYPEAFHELHHEPIAATVLADVLDWMEAGLAESVGKPTTP